MRQAFAVTAVFALLCLGGIAQADTGGFVAIHDYRLDWYSYVISGNIRGCDYPLVMWSTHGPIQATVRDNADSTQPPTPIGGYVAPEGCCLYFDIGAPLEEGDFGWAYSRYPTSNNFWMYLYHVQFRVESNYTASDLRLELLSGSHDAPVIWSANLATGYNDTLVDMAIQVQGKDSALSFRIAPVPVPEPSPIIALLGGLGSLLAFRRRRR